MNDGCRRVGNSKRLRQVMQITLVIGNNMNTGFGGAAQGFKISSMLKVLRQLFVDIVASRY